MSALPIAERSGGAGNSGGMYVAGIWHLRLGHRDLASEWLKRAVGAGHPRAQEALDAHQL